MTRLPLCVCLGLFVRVCGTVLSVVGKFLSWHLSYPIIHRVLERINLYPKTGIEHLCKYSKTCVKRPLSKRQKIGLEKLYRLMQVESTAECSKGKVLQSMVESIAECSKGKVLQNALQYFPLELLQYFRPSLRFHLSFRSLFCSLLNGRFTQVLLYDKMSLCTTFHSIMLCNFDLNSTEHLMRATFANHFTLSFYCNALCQFRVKFH